MKTILAVSFLSFVLTHPFDKIETNATLDFQNDQHFTNGNQYIMPIDGMIEKITTEGGLSTIYIKENNGEREFVYSGLTNLFVNVGGAYKKGEIIGMDDKIDKNTKYVCILYNEAKIFPQFIKNELIFYTPMGTKIYLSSDGSIIEKGTDFQMGNYIVFLLKDKNINIYYKHLYGFAKSMRKHMLQGDLVAYTGTSGAVDIPQLEFLFEIKDNTELNFRAIYIKTN